MMMLQDSFGRIHDYLRISLTDRCNLSCIYCNPDSSQTNKLKREEELSYEELLRLVNIFVERFGFKKIRLTGGEPLLRKELTNFLSPLFDLKKRFGFQLGITTNGILLNRNVDMLKRFGFDHLNISLDSLNIKSFERITGSNKLNDLISAIENAAHSGFQSLKINTVIIRNVNDYEILDFVRFAAEQNLNVRFIEFMPFSNNGWNESSFISSNEIKETVETVYKIEKLSSPPNVVGTDYNIIGSKGKISFISPMSDHFCAACNRLRITSNGKLKLCLFSSIGEDLDLKLLLRDKSIPDDWISEKIVASMSNKKFKHPEIIELRKLEKNNMLSIGG